MILIYNSIAIDVMTLDHFFYDVVMDDSQTDYVMTKVEILCSGILNGQAEVRTLAGPPISYLDTGATAARQAEAVTNRPPGVPAPPAGAATPPTTNAGLKSAGVFRDQLADNTPANAYVGAFTPGFGPPAFATDVRTVEVVVKAPNAAGLTTRLIEKRLTDPRGKLFVFSGNGGAPGDLILMSPSTFAAHCDVKNGPKPTHFGITSAHGDFTTAFVQFGIETYIHTQARTDVTDPLLSNRWTMRHSLDEDSWLRIQVDGTAVFDTGILHTRGINPDTFRPNLMLPVPLGFKRDAIDVWGEPDMSAVHYSFIDMQQPINFPAGPYRSAQRIEAMAQQSVLCDNDVLHGALESYEGVLRRDWNRKSLDEMKRAFAEREIERTRARRAYGGTRRGRP